MSTTKIHFGFLLILAGLLSIPFAVSAVHIDGHTGTEPPPTATGFLREGVFGCSAGRYPLDVAALQSVQGVYVPVNDAAVTLNTGYLVYKECVLDGVVSATREAATGAMVRSILTAAQRGRNGAPEYVAGPARELGQRADVEMIEFVKQYNVRDICTPFQQQVRVAVVNEYFRSTRDPNISFRCSIEPSELAARNRGEFTGWDTWMDLLDPSNTELGSYFETSFAASNKVRQETENLAAQWQWADGWYPREERVCTPTEFGEEKCEWRTLTPGNMVAKIVEQAVTSGFRQLENADEIDQVVNSLFSGVTNQIMGDVRGFAGLSENRLGRAPYLDQLSAASSGRLRDSAANTGITILNAAIAIEQEFNSKKRAIKALLEQAASQLRAAETQCWIRVEEAVRTLAQQEGAQLRISTSTERITGGTVALRLAPGVQIQSGTAFTLSAPPSPVLESAILTVTANISTSSAAQQDIGLPISPMLAPIAGAAFTINTAATTPFGPGTLAIRLRPGQKLPIGDVRFALTAVLPFSQAAVSILVDIARQFADQIIEQQITPALQQANQDITASNNGLTQLLQIASDLRNTGSLSAQRIALERLDTLIAQRLIHTSADVANAERQRTDAEGLVRTLVEDTVNSWTTGGGWCNVTNPNVVREWFNRWRI